MFVGIFDNNPLTKQWIRYLNRVIVLLFISSLLACSKNKDSEKIMDYLIKVDDVIVNQEEVMIYVYQVVEEFEQVGGETVWEFEDFSGGKSALEVAKEAVLENVVRIKVLNKKSKELNIKLTESQSMSVEEQSTQYFELMNARYKEMNHITLELLIKVFREFAIAKEVVMSITQDFNPTTETILDRMNNNQEYKSVQGLDTKELLTEIQVNHILIETRVKDENGSYVILTDEEKVLKYNMAKEVLQYAENGIEFSQLIHEYSDEDFLASNYSFSKALLPDEFRLALEGLETNKLSDIVESPQGYHIFKVVDIIIPTEEDIEKFKTNYDLFEENLQETVINELKQEAFNKLYLEWKQYVLVSLDNEKWKTLSLQIEYDE